MLKELMLSAAIAALAVGPALAQDTSTTPQQSPTIETPPPPAPTAQDQSAAPAPGSEPVPPPAADVMAEEQVAPPPADAIIAAEGATDMRADRLIGTSVYNAEGQEVGSVQDIVFDKDGKIVGVVLKVGGLLGLGGKSVGIRWDEVQVVPQDDTMKISYTEDQLKVAPAFKTQEAIAAEKELDNTQSQAPAVPTAPATTE